MLRFTKSHLQFISRTGKWWSWTRKWCSRTTKCWRRIRGSSSWCGRGILAEGAEETMEDMLDWALQEVRSREPAITAGRVLKAHLLSSTARKRLRKRSRLHHYHWLEGTVWDREGGWGWMREGPTSPNLYHLRNYPYLELNCWSIQAWPHHLWEQARLSCHRLLPQPGGIRPCSVNYRCQGRVRCRSWLTIFHQILWIRLKDLGPKRANGEKYK